MLLHMETLVNNTRPYNLPVMRYLRAVMNDLRLGGTKRAPRSSAANIKRSGRLRSPGRFTLRYSCLLAAVLLAAPGENRSHGGR